MTNLYGISMECQYKQGVLQHLTSYVYAYNIVEQMCDSVTIVTNIVTIVTIPTLLHHSLDKQISHTQSQLVSQDAPPETSVKCLHPVRIRLQ